MKSKLFCFLDLLEHKNYKLYKLRMIKIYT